MKRRKFLAAAAATATVAVAAAPATALPARVLDSIVPCDGRVLPICDYEELYRALYAARIKTEVIHNAFAFRVPDLRARIVSDSDPDLNRVLPVVYAIVAQPGMQMPVGTILPVMVRYDG